MSDDKTNRPTETQDRPNLSTEHQEPGDARRPRDTLDREPRGEKGREEDKGTAPASRPPEKVEDRPNVSQVDPEDYPDKAKGQTKPNDR